MSALNKQTLTESGANDRPPILEKGIIFHGREGSKGFRNNKLEDGEQMWRSIIKGPYERPMILDPDNTQVHILEPLSKMTESNKKQYIADVKFMNYLLQAIPNDIYNTFNASKERESLESVYDSLVQFKLHIQLAENRVEKICYHALIVHSNASSSQSHASSSYSHSPQPYYITHPSLVVDYKEDYKEELQGDSQEYKLTTTMMLLAQAITKKFSTPTNNHLPNVRCYNCNEKSHYARDCPKPRVHYAKYFKEQRLLAMKDEARINVNDEENHFILDNSFRDETLEKLTTAVIMMARTQPANDNGVNKPNYDAKAVSKRNASHKGIHREVHEHKNHRKCKTIINTSDDNQIDSNIIFDDPYKENNGGSNEHDSIAHDQYHDTYAYGDVCSQNQDLLMTISELKNKTKTIKKGKNVNTKFDKSKTQGTLLCVTPLPKHIEVKAKKVSNAKVNADRSKPVTSHSIPKTSKVKNQSANILARGMYRITKTENHTTVSKTNMNVSNSTCVESNNSVRRPQFKDTKSKNRVLKNTNDKVSSAHDQKMSSSDIIDSNKHETVNLISRDSMVKRALFTTLVAAKSKNLGATSVVVKSKLSVAKTPTATNKEVQLVLWIIDSGCSKRMIGNMTMLINFVEKFIRTVRFGNDHFITITGYEDFVQGNLTIYLVDGILKFKYDKDYLYSACDQGKSKKACFPLKLDPSTESKLELLHMHLYGPMRIESINGKKYILVSVDDYSRYTQVYFLRTKDEAPNMIVNFITQVQRNLKAQILKIRIDNGTEFKNEKLRSFYAKLGIVHHTLIA
nr:integrase, catalytic region, zinc finger, CCHC-type, peptidase aspartic, catalytic [Tanacetum cinerariifolium]